MSLLALLALQTWMEGRWAAAAAPPGAQCRRRAAPGAAPSTLLAQRLRPSTLTAASPDARRHPHHQEPHYFTRCRNNPGAAASRAISAGCAGGEADYLENVMNLHAAAEVHRLQKATFEGSTGYSTGEPGGRRGGGERRCAGCEGLRPAPRDVERARPRVARGHHSLLPAPRHLPPFGLRRAQARATRRRRRWPPTSGRSCPGSSWCWRCASP